MVGHAKARGVDGVICGHIHVAADREVDGVRYLNCGDWVDSCTAIVEHRDGCVALLAVTTGSRGLPSQSPVLARTETRDRSHRHC